MAKAPTKKPDHKTVTLATGTSVSGPAALVDKMAGKAKSDAAKSASK